MNYNKIFLVLWTTWIAFWLLCAVLSAEDAISLKVTPTVGIAPVTVKISVTVSENEIDIEEVCVVLDGEILSSSCWPHSTRVTETQIRDIPAGEYSVWAFITRRSGKQVLSKSVTVIVKGV